MPASRARGIDWRRTLTELCGRDGSLELAIAPPDGIEDSTRGDLVWRVRLLRVGEDELLVEAPRALGRDISFAPQTELLAAVVIGQNRWTFRSRVVSATSPHRSERGGTLALEAPDHLERCQRRHGRYDARGLHLPEVDLWPLLDPASVVETQRAVERLVGDAIGGRPVDLSRIETKSPVVGPRFGATLMNIGGGGIGVRVEPGDAPVLTRHPVLWLRIPLGSAMPVPVLVTGKVVHTHIDSAQLTYAGLAFDFTFNPPAQQVVAEQILFTIRSQMARRPLRAA